MRSVRLDAGTEQKLKTAAELSGKPVSEIIREAVNEKCAQIISDRLDVRLADVIGSVKGSGTNSRHTGRDFAELLEQKERIRRRRRRR